MSRSGLLSASCCSTPAPRSLPRAPTAGSRAGPMTSTTISAIRVMSMPRSRGRSLKPEPGSDITTTSKGLAPVVSSGAMGSMCTNELGQPCSITNGRAAPSAVWRAGRARGVRRRRPGDWVLVEPGLLGWPVKLLWPGVREGAQHRAVHAIVQPAPSISSGQRVPRSRSRRSSRTAGSMLISKGWRS